MLEVGRGFYVSGLCGQLFAGLGGTVKVVRLPGTPILAEPATPEGRAYLDMLLNAGKSTESLSGDAKTREAELRALIAQADVVLIDQDASGELAILGDAGAFEAEWPEKILCTVSLFGANSSRSDWIGNELVAEAWGALMACNGYPELPPVTSGLPYAIHTAALFAFNGVMTALWERIRSQRGQTIDLAIVDCLVAILGNFLPSYFLSGRSPKRIGNRHTIAAPWNIYPASDGSVVICTGTGGAGWWAKVMAVLERPDLIDDLRYATEAARVRNVEEVDAILSEWTSQRTMRAIVDLMTTQSIPVSEISTIEQVIADPHYWDLRAMVLPSADGSRGRPGVGIPLKVGDWQDDPQPGPRDPGNMCEEGNLRGRGDPEGRGPLAGIRILEFASRTSVPLAARLMADLGADVVKIEPAKGDALRGAGQQIGGSSYLFHINNAGKRSIVVNPAEPDGRELIFDLVRNADVFMENLAPGSLAKMGLAYADLQAVNPDLIYCSVSGFGARSNYGSKRALDTVVQAACGLMHMTGYPDHFPVKLGISAIDLTTATAAMAAVLAALRERLLTGKGSYVDLAMADVGVWMTQRVWPRILCEGSHPVRLGNASPDACPHDIFPTSDDHFVAIAVETDAQWRSLVGLIAHETLYDEAMSDRVGRLARRESIGAVVAAWTSKRTSDEVAALCQANGVPAASVRDLVELAADPGVSERKMIVRIDHATAGNLRLLGNPIMLSRTPPLIETGAPGVGENNSEIISDWLGRARQLSSGMIGPDRARTDSTALGDMPEAAITLNQRG